MEQYNFHAVITVTGSPNIMIPQLLLPGGNPLKDGMNCTILGQCAKLDFHQSWKQHCQFLID